MKRETIKRHDIPFDEALKTVLSAISPLPPEEACLERLTGRVAEEDIVSLLDSPSADVSLKDGYAVRSVDIEGASPESPVTLRLAGRRLAGSEEGATVTMGTAVRVTSGAVIPPGADAVLAEEFAREEGGTVKATADAHRGRNILKKGTDIGKGETVMERGNPLLPADMGLIAASGHSRVRVHRNPLVAVIATGDEVVAAGMPVPEGKVAASNLVTITSWCALFGMETRTFVLRDSEREIADAIGGSIRDADCIVTSGGSWKGERDLVVRVLDGLGWRKIFHRVKMGPGKAVAFGFLDEKPVFCLPGGPPSNQMAFLELALPGLLSLGGRTREAFPVIPAMLERDVQGQRDWTQFIMGLIKKTGEGIVFTPIVNESRLQSLSNAEGVIRIPEGVERIPGGSMVEVQVLKGGY